MIISTAKWLQQFRLDTATTGIAISQPKISVSRDRRYTEQRKHSREIGFRVDPKGRNRREALLLNLCLRSRSHKAGMLLTQCQEQTQFSDFSLAVQSAQGPNSVSIWRTPHSASRVAQIDSFPVDKKWQRNSTEVGSIGRVKCLKTSLLLNREVSVIQRQATVTITADVYSVDNEGLLTALTVRLLLEGAFENCNRLQQLWLSTRHNEMLCY